MNMYMFIPLQTECCNGLIGCMAADWPVFHPCPKCPKTGVNVRFWHWVQRGHSSDRLVIETPHSLIYFRWGLWSTTPWFVVSSWQTVVLLVELGCNVTKLVVAVSTGNTTSRLLLTCALKWGIFTLMCLVWGHTLGTLAMASVSSLFSNTVQRTVGILIVLGLILSLISSISPIKPSASCAELNTSARFALKVWQGRRCHWSFFSLFVDEPFLQFQNDFSSSCMGHWKTLTHVTDSVSELNHSQQISPKIAAISVLKISETFFKCSWVEQMSSTLVRCLNLLMSSAYASIFPTDADTSTSGLR